MSIKILLAEDQSLIRSSLEMLISEVEDFEVIASIARGDEALEVYRSVNPDLAILDIRMPGLSGLEVAREIKRENPENAVILLTTFEEEEPLQEALRLGVEGYLLKDIEPELFIQAIRSAAGGLLVFHPLLKAALAGSDHGETAKPRENPYGLTSRDLEFIVHIVGGLGNKEIAFKEGCTEGTVKNRISSILSKMGLKARTQIAVVALREELI